MSTPNDVEIVFLIGSGEEQTQSSIKMNGFPPYQVGEKITFEFTSDTEPGPFVIEKIVNVVKVDEKNIEMIKRIYHVKRAPVSERILT